MYLCQRQGLVATIGLCPHLDFNWRYEGESLIELQFFRILKITPLNRSGAAGRGSFPPLVSPRLAFFNVFLIQDTRFKPDP